MLRTFSERIGRTHGIRFRIRPPQRARRRLMIRLASTFGGAPVSEPAGLACEKLVGAVLDAPFEAGESATSNACFSLPIFWTRTPPILVGQFAADFFTDTRNETRLASTGKRSGLRPTSKSSLAYGKKSTSVTGLLIGHSMRRLRALVVEDSS